MARLRRRTTQPQKSLIEYLAELSEPDTHIPNLYSKKELKLEMEWIRLETKINKQIRKFIDRRLSQLEAPTEK